MIEIDVQGTIKFCSSQVENVLLHTSTDLLGSNIQDLVAPDSQCTMQKLIQDLASSIERLAVNNNISDPSSDANKHVSETTSLDDSPDDLESASFSGSIVNGEGRGSYAALPDRLF